MRIRGAEIVVRTLVEQGVNTIFGYPGGAVLDIYDALYDCKDIRHIMTSHEQGASHAADGYARSTGKTGVVLATSGPGATNIVTGIATAYMDSIPMVCITGNVAQSLIGKDSFQEIHITGVTMPITKHNFIVRNVNELADTIRDAFRIANTGRKGPVLIDITKDITKELGEYEIKNKISIKKESVDDVKKLKEVANLINKSEKPVIYSGGGVVSSNASEELKKLIYKADIPACNTIMGIGAIGEESNYNLGMIGMHGKVSTNFAIENSDLILALGVRFSDRVALNVKHFAPNAKIIHIDIDASEIGKNVDVYCGVVGDVKDVLSKILPYIDKNSHKDWFDQIDEYRKKDYIPTDDDKNLKPHQIIEFIAKKSGNDAIIVTDVGQHQMWAAQYSHRVKPRTFITSGGLGTMGFGYGAAIGAKVANPNVNVIHISGDGSFHMNMNECPTATHYNINTISVVLNNHALGMPRQWQHFLYNDRYSSSDFYRNTDYIKLAEAFGAKGYSCKNIYEFKKAFEEALTLNKTVIIECMVDSNENVFPMIPAGGTVENLILE